MERVSAHEPGLIPCSFWWWIACGMCLTSSFNDRACSCASVLVFLQSRIFGVDETSEPACQDSLAEVLFFRYKFLPQQGDKDTTCRLPWWQSREQIVVDLNRSDIVVGFEVLSPFIKRVLRCCWWLCFCSISDAAWHVAACSVKRAGLRILWKIGARNTKKNNKRIKPRSLTKLPHWPS